MTPECLSIAIEATCTDGKLYGYLMEMQGFMRHVILVLIALMALGGLLPAVMSLPACTHLIQPTAAMPDTLTTPSMAAFLNDSWTPSAFCSSASQVEDTLFTKKSLAITLLHNSTYAAYDFLNSSNVTSTAAVSHLLPLPLLERIIR